MNLKFQRAVDRYAGVPICALLSLLERFRGKAPLAAPPKKILVILLSEMGSLVLAHPMFARLKQRYPEASIYVLQFAKNREVLDLLGVIPEENVLTLDDGSLGGLVRDSLSAIRTLRALRIDAVIDCELFARISSIFSWLSGAPLRVGFHRHTQEGLYRGSFINRPVMYNPYRHLSHQFLTMVEALESTTMPPVKFLPEPDPCKPPQLVFAPQEREEVAAQLHRDFPAISDKKLVLVYPSGGILPIRAWPLENYHRLCKTLLDEGYAVAITGMKGDQPLAQTIVDHCQSASCINLAGYTKSVRQLLALFHRASLLVTNDGGPGQFAALTPLPTITFFGPETPLLYQPLGTNGYCFHQPLPCSPCLTAYNHRSSPCDGDNQCLKQITTEQVLAKAREMLGATAVAPDRKSA
ncbi:MAG: glycosyl transferase [Gallionellales bacterium RIFCSPLOWO2_02_FULL_57_47]|nr:MAG: glycosyl transferase [Gallionellales bacterium RIFCSPLOWO2_02_FULL_57_47]OGT07576.1 MAG: glycosyl transferase [Gallionellales bacterium RIFCSPHIGHO2_02_FULL_57_16]